MKRVLITIGAIILWGCNTGINAQTRNVDVDVRLFQPLDNTTIPIGEQFDVEMSFKNMGPDDMLAGDTLVYIFSTMQVPEGFVLADDIKVNDSFVYTRGWTINGAPPEPVPFCIFSTVFAPDVTTEVDSFCIMLTFVDETTRIENVLPGTKETIKKLNLSPNPASAVVHLNYELKETSDVYLQITDITGKVVMKNVWVRQTEGEHQKEVDISALTNGIYFVEIAEGNSRSREKLLIQR